MAANEHDHKVLFTLFGIVILGILVFLAIKSIILSVFAGLLLAYIFSPIYKKILSKVKGKNTAAALVLVIAILIVVIPIWIIAPLVANQVFEVFTNSQTLDVREFIQNTSRALIPTASEQFITQITVSFSGVVSESASLVLTSLVQLFLDIPKILLNTFIIFFTFFYGLRDSEKLKEFVKGISPLSRSKEKLLVKQFRDITDSLVYGQVIVGLVQGLLAGIGFWLFGVPNAFVLALVAVAFAIIPIIGPAIVWIPASVYLFVTGSTGMAVAFLIYNLFLVSTSDNLLRTHIVSKKAKLSPLIVFIGMIGGIFLFGILGLILGPLILAYFITFLEIYKANKISSVFQEEANET